MTALARALVALLADPIADALAEHDAVPLRLVLEEMARPAANAPAPWCACGRWITQAQNSVGGNARRLYCSDACRRQAARVRDAGRWRHG